MVGTDSLDELVHVRNQESFQLALLLKWDSQDDQQHGGTFALLSTQHQIQYPYHDHSDEHALCSSKSLGN